MVAIKGLEKFSSKDFPGHISATVFLGGCSFRCPYCHNRDLVLNPEEYPTIDMDGFLGFLDSRMNWLEGVCISGGEPLLSEELETLIRVVKERKFLVKLDTNGSCPERLAGLLREGLLDWIAMDIKAPLDRYREVTRSDVRESDIERSASLIRASGLPHIFRTTVVPTLIGREDIRRIGEWLQGAELYQLQQFVPRNTIDPAFLDVAPYPREEFVMLAEIAENYFGKVLVEGA